MSSKADERACLADTITVGMNLCGAENALMRRLARKFSACLQVTGREDNEGPDFLLDDPMNSGAKSVIGIEHFYVSNYSERTVKDKVSTPNRKRKSEVASLCKEWCDTFAADANSLDGSMRSLLKEAYADLTTSLKSDYFQFVSSFEYSLNLHIGKVDSYKENIAEHGATRSKLAFLIEIDAPFNDLRLLDFKGWHVAESVPMFSKVVSLLEAVDRTVVDYIILHMKTQSGLTKLIALRTGAISNQLKKQHIRSYAYVDSGAWCTYDTIDVPEPTVVRNSDRLDANVTYRLKNTTREDFEQSFAQTSLAFVGCVQMKKHIAITRMGYALLGVFEDLERMAKTNPAQANKKRIEFGTVLFEYIQKQAQENDFKVGGIYE